MPTFSLRLDPPPPLDRGRLVATMRRSADRFGRPREDVAKQIEEALVRRGVNVGPSRQAPATMGSAQQGDPEITDDTQPSAKQNPNT